DDPGRNQTAPDIDLERRAGCRRAGRNVAESDERAQRGGARPAGDAPDPDAVPTEGIAMARYARLIELDAYQPPLDSRLRLRGEGGTADEITLAELDDPGEPGLERRGGRVHVASMEWQPGLESKRVPGTQPARQPLPPRRRLEQGVPQLARRPCVHQELEAVLTRVTRPADDDRKPGDESLHPREWPEHGQIERREGTQRELGIRPLERQEG